MNCDCSKGFGRSNGSFELCFTATTSQQACGV